MSYPVIDITGILESYPQTSKRNTPEGQNVPYVVINPTETERIPAYFARSKTFDTSRGQYDRDGARVTLSDEPGAFCVFLPNLALFGDCRPGDHVTLRAKVYPVREAYQSNKDKRNTGVSNISDIYFEAESTIQKAKAGK